MKYKTPKQYKQDCINMGLDLPVDSYINSKTKIKHKCKKCNKMYEQSPNNHLQGKGCPKCGGVYRNNMQDYIKECKRLGIDLPIEEYVNNKTKINHKCSKCGYVYKQRPDNHLHNNGCPNCRGKFKKVSQEYYNECKQRGLDLPVENYINALTKIKHRCNRGHVYKQQPSSHLSNNGCPKCARERISSSIRKDSNTYTNECEQKGYDLPIEPYINTHTKIKHRCKQCGRVYEQRPSLHLRGQGCPICNESHGERFIRSYLNKHNIPYESQKKFNDLKDKTYLSYDFYLPEQKVLIEYQGKQHYEKCNYFGGEEQLKNQQLHDKLKREYAKNNGYTLLEPTYKLNTQDKVNKYLYRNIRW